MSTAKRFLSECTSEQWTKITKSLVKDIANISEDIYELIDKKEKEAMEEKILVLQKKMEQLLKSRKKI